MESEKTCGSCANYEASRRSGPNFGECYFITGGIINSKEYVANGEYAATSVTFHKDFGCKFWEKDTNERIL